MLGKQNSQHYAFKYKDFVSLGSKLLTPTNLRYYSVLSESDNYELFPQIVQVPLSRAAQIGPTYKEHMGPVWKRGLTTMLDPGPHPSLFVIL